MRGMQNIKNTREVSQPVWREVAGEGGCSGWRGCRGKGGGQDEGSEGWFGGFNGCFLILFSQVNTQRKAIVQLILEKRELLVGQRVKRDGTGNLS